ncbi:MAG TPA: hypothetical protein VKX17_22080 [Planctomycetota bacterium]|nr:hypothetical protein [Planctomycetota bacterium]
MPVPENSFLQDGYSTWEFLRAEASQLWTGVTHANLGMILAIGTLALWTLAGWAVTLGRMALRLRNLFRKKRPPKEPNPWVKRIGVALAFLVPGGLVGTAAVALVMGKENWRRDAVLIVGAAMIPGAALWWLNTADFQYPVLHESLILQCTLAVTFGVLHLWAAIKLMRETLGEPVEKVRWWPPLGLWLQTCVLATGLGLLL